MAVEDLMRAGLDYGRCTYGTSRLVFRGPCREAGADIAVLGGTQVFGKFVEHPFPAILEARLGRPVLNLGAMNAGLEAFCADPVLDEVVAHVLAVVLVIPGAESASNAFYTVHPRRNDRVTAVSKRLRALYPDLDFSEVSFVRGFLNCLHRACPARFAVVVAELRRNWLCRMRSTLDRIGVPVLLLWLSERLPQDREAASRPYGPDPLFVTRPMIDRIAPSAAGLVDVVQSPTQLSDLQDMHFAELDRPAALSVPCSGAHAEIAETVEVALRPLHCRGWRAAPVRIAQSGSGRA